MSRNRKPRTKTEGRSLDNGLIELAGNVSGLNGTTGGSVLSSYGTSAFSNNYSLITLNRIILTYMYTGNGIFQTAVQLPIQDAIGKGFELESGELDNEDIEKVYEYWEEKGILDSILNYWTWVRLYGGGALLVNTNQDPKEPLSYRGLQDSAIELYDLDRWQLDANKAITGNFEEHFKTGDENEIISLYGQPIHQSRFLIGRGKRAPHYVRQTLRGWGMSEAERMLRDLNSYLKTQDVTYEILDEAKIDVFKINGLAEKLISKGGTAKITQRVQAANEIKNYINALVMDTKEEYEQKTMSFAGLAEIMNQNRMGVAAALRMPMTKLFGLSASGFNTGESDLENYNAMVESEIRAPLKPVFRQLLKITMSHLFGYVPSFTFKFPSLRELTPDVEASVKTQATTRILSFYDRGLINSEQALEQAQKEGLVSVKADDKQSLSPAPPNGDDSVDPVEEPIDSENVQDAALNGAQVASLVDVAIRAKSGELTPESALAIIKTANPNLSESTAKEIIGMSNKGLSNLLNKFKRK